MEPPPFSPPSGPIVIKPWQAGQAHVAVIYMGGTVGMKPNAAGALEPSPGYLAERMAAMHEFERDAMPGVSLFELGPPVDSSDMGPPDWARLAATIEALYLDYDGFTVIMGTDTMAYAASALSFMREEGTPGRRLPPPPF